VRKDLIVAAAFVAMAGVVTVIVEYMTVDESGYGAIMRFFGYGAPPKPAIPETLQQRGLHLMNRLVNAHGWTPEGAAIAAFAKARGQDYQDVDVQIDFFEDEVTHRSEAELGWKNLTHLDEAARMGHLFEVYSSNTTWARVNDAKLWLKIYREKHDSKTR